MAGAASQVNMDPAKIEAVLELFRAAGHQFVSLPILQPADIFLDLTGEDIRRRLFLTNGTDGVDLCLRPDFTIPVCRQHLTGTTATLPAAYCYHGPVFRQRADGLGEIPQLGAESLGRHDTANADADLLTLSVKALETFGLEDMSIRIGDETLFAAVLAGLDLPTVWRRRLRDLFGEPDKLSAAIDRMAGNGSAEDNNLDIRPGFLSALEGSDPKAAHAVVEDLLSIAGISAVGGRTPGEIADRFLEQAALSSGAGGQEKSAETLKAYLDIQTTGADAVDALRNFAAQSNLDLASAIAVFEQRLDAIANAGLAASRLTFAAEFGRRLDYYSGFVFEIHPVTTHDDGPLVGGGRYDRLVTLLGSETDVPSIGFSMWLDRISRATGG